MNYRAYCWYIYHKFVWGYHCPGVGFAVTGATTQTSSPGGLAVSSFFTLEMWGRQSPSEMMGDVGLTWQLWDTQLSWSPLQALLHQSSLSWRAEEPLVRNVPHLSQCCSAVDICWVAGHSCPWWHCCATLSAGWSCSPDHLHSELIWPWDGAVHLSNHLKQNHFYDHFLWRDLWKSYMGVYFQHCCSYLRTYLDGILQSLLKFAWITLLIFYCSTWIKWQAEMLIRLKFPSAMQVLLMLQLAVEWNKITSTVLVFISLNKQQKFSRIISLNRTFRVHFINLQR